jgi:hypothetical protein
MISLAFRIIKIRTQNSVEEVVRETVLRELGPERRNADMGVTLPAVEDDGRAGARPSLTTNSRRIESTGS